MGSDPLIADLLIEPNQEMGSDPDFPDFNAIPIDEYPGHRHELIRAYRAVRNHSRVITSPYSEAEHQIQSMPDASPTKWHLAHTTWFFETFILARFKPGFEWFDKDYCYLFNSYYNAIGAQYPRPKRGLITHPDLQGVWEYRSAIDHEILELLETTDNPSFLSLADTLVLGLNHEQQHQELMVTDIKHALYQGSVISRPVSGNGPTTNNDHEEWLEWSGGRVEIGYPGGGFCFDNELARHEVLIPPFKMSQHLVTAAQWLEFMEDGGYQRPLLWLSDGWQWMKENGLESPLYWRKSEDGWCQFGRNGWTWVDPGEPVKHISYYEADAFATWASARLPRETEWECITSGPVETSPSDQGRCWEWTQSAYCAYPGFQPTAGAAGEYNGKFMVNQMVLRGASTATSRHHSRPSYRNFFPPVARWQFTGLRLAKDLP